jgi:phosphonopyruvate decarboxylase
MGSMHTVGKLKPKNLIHVLINNDMHDSVGGQVINTIGVDFAKISKLLGYKESFTV